MTEYAYDPYAPVRQTNGMGIAGFVISLVGLVATGGLLSPIGLVLSLIALGRQPRGFAIAGVILGLVGSCGGLLMLLVFGAAILAALGLVAVAAIAFSEPQKLEVTTDMVSIAMAIDKYRQENRYLPAGLELLPLDENRLTDPWGERYRYEQKDERSEFDLVTAGEDKTFGTKDDVRLTEIDKMWAMSKGVRVHTSGRNGNVKIDLGDNTIDVVGDENGKQVKIQVGGRTIEVTGDENGGRVDTREAPAPSDEPAEPEAP